MFLLLLWSLNSIEELCRATCIHQMKTSPGEVLIQNQNTLPKQWSLKSSWLRSPAMVLIYRATETRSLWWSVVGKTEQPSWTDKNVPNELFSEDYVLPDHGIILTPTRTEEETKKASILYCSQNHWLSKDLPWFTPVQDPIHSIPVSWHNVTTKMSHLFSSVYLAVQVGQSGKEKPPQLLIN